MRDDKSNEKAVRFSNLLSRFSSTGVVNKKSAILSLMYHLADSGDIDDAVSAEDGAPDTNDDKNGEDHLEEAFSPMGLHTLPSRDSRNKPTSNVRKDNVAWTSSATNSGQTKAMLLATEKLPSGTVSIVPAECTS